MNKSKKHSARSPLLVWYFLVSLVVFLLSPPAALWGAEKHAKVYVILWFDTEDYILPASDDAALRVAELLTKENVRATFKVVGEKARTLERRGRTDVIAALQKHEIGYHSNWHSVQPTPAMYLSNVGWDEGVAEFDRREKPGYDDVKRIFGVAPSCYGQPGSSWGPQSFGAMRKWGMQVYLDAGSHVRLNDRPHYYCGIFTLYKLAHTIRADLGKPELKEAEDRFLEAHKKLLAEGGGVVSIVYHPCEFVHKEFWDGVNFRKGANPPREQWKLPPTKTAAETSLAFQVFEKYVQFMKHLPDVQFITASEAAQIYRDKARGRDFPDVDIVDIARSVQDNVTFQERGDFSLSAAEVFALLDLSFSARLRSRTLSDEPMEDMKRRLNDESLGLLGPTERIALMSRPITTDWSQFTRTAVEVADYLRKHGRIPSTVWLGSVPISPEAFLQALARVTIDLAEKKPPPKNVEIQPARLAAAQYVADDGPNLWGWVIFPDGFRAPGMMALARQQAWTLKPALIDRSKR
jgi:hypothetical protein